MVIQGVSYGNQHYKYTTLQQNTYYDPCIEKDYECANGVVKSCGNVCMAHKHISDNCTGYAQTCCIACNTKKYMSDSQASDWCSTKTNDKLENQLVCEAYHEDECPSTAAENGTTDYDTTDYDTTDNSDESNTQVSFNSDDQVVRGLNIKRTGTVSRRL